MDALITAWLIAHPRELSAIIVAGVFGSAIAAVWQLIPAKTRDALEAKCPRSVGVLRVVCAIFANVVDAARAVQHQVVKGTPKPKPDAK